MRSVIERAVRRTCEVRSWSLLAINVRMTHVHVVVAAPEAAPERVLNAFKAWATRALREGGHLDADAPMWSRHGSTRYLWIEDDVVSARSYVLHHQGSLLPGSGLDEFVIE